MLVKICLYVPCVLYALFGCCNIHDFIGALDKLLRRLRLEKLIDSNGITISLWLFYASRLRNRVLCVFIFISKGFFFAQGPMKYEWFLNISIWPTDKILTGPSTPGLNEPGSNVNDGVIHLRQISRTGASLSDEVWCHTQDKEEALISVNFLSLTLLYN